MSNDLVAKLQTPVWVGWKKLEINGKITKQPRYLHKAASTIDPQTWQMYDQAIVRVDSGYGKGAYDGVGFIINKEHTKIVGIDLDHVLRDGNILRSDVLDFLMEANTYTEVSPSGDGLHVIFFVSDPQKMKANKHRNEDGTAFECYSDARYFTFTGNVYHTYTKVREVDFQEVERVLEILGYPWSKSLHIASIGKSPSLPNLSDQEVIRLAFESKNGAKVQKLYNGDISDYNGDASSGDMALCSHLSFFSGNPEQTERLWLSSPLGQREKTQKRQDYRQRTVNNVFAGKSEFYNPTREIIPPFISGKHTNKEKPSLIGKDGKNGIITKPIFENVRRLMEWDGDFSDKLAFNSFSQKVEYQKRQLTDQDEIEIWGNFQQKYPQLSDVSKAVISDAIVSVAFARQYNPIVDWLNSLEWDGINRLESFIDDVMGYPQEDDEGFFAYRQSVGTNLMKSLVARALEAGVKYDHMIVLEGRQGCGKSTFVQALVGSDYLYETIAKDITNKDFHINSRNAWIVHFDEGESLKYNSVESLKHMITNQYDTYRPPYGKNEKTIPRKYIYIMSTNDAQYLRDQTGNRRFLPIRVNLDFVDIDYFRKNRDQLFAEAVALWKQDKSFEIPTEEAEKQQQSRMIVDPIDAMVEDYVQEITEYCGVDYSEIWASEFEREPNRNDIIRINSALSRLGFEQKQVRVNNGRKRKWFRKEEYKA